jgi:hypothetical protein
MEKRVDELLKELVDLALIHQPKPSENVFAYDENKNVFIPVTDVSYEKGYGLLFHIKV